MRDEIRRLYDRRISFVGGRFWRAPSFAYYRLLRRDAKRRWSQGASSALLEGSRFAAVPTRRLSPQGLSITLSDAPPAAAISNARATSSNGCTLVTIRSVSIAPSSSSRIASA